ncbi:DNA polymerase A, putative [Bodo saltans]|uniref:DNA-directed DNA polymerase n=1 Tax=Bodo saltans TaxID=75058 RepID=A0A0S4J2T7_BODSA|nr:DNA polymerase A, putative [Bodo saltans]|eukprot:CUG84853.1 DNA polymerase A, putative [Bodo saltans]
MPCLERTFDSKFLPTRGGKKRRARIAQESRSTKATVLKALTRLFPDCRLPSVIREFRTMQGWLEKYIEPLIQLERQGQPTTCMPRPSEGRTSLLTSGVTGVGGQVRRTSVLLRNSPSGRFAVEVVGADCGQMNVNHFSVASSGKRVHGEYCQTATATGRLAMNDPNLQTIPHPITFTLPASSVPSASAEPQQQQEGEGGAEVAHPQQGDVTVPLRLRHAFVARPGCVLISADYKQIEARLLAHFSRDARLMAAFSGGGDPQRTTTTNNGSDESSTLPQAASVDIFISMAVDIFKKHAASEVTPEERRQAKTLCYAMLYGKGRASIADDLEITEDEAQTVLDNFHAAFPVAQTFVTSLAAEATRNGYVETITKRRRWLPYAASAVQRFQSASARIAVNTACQGSAADMVKLAMIRLCEHKLFTTTTASIVAVGDGGDPVITCSSSYFASNSR